MIKALVFAMLLASCASRQTYPTTNEDEKRWLQDYRDGKLSWSEYQEHLKAERGP